MAINQTQIMTTLAYLLGESSVPTSGVDDRKEFIQQTLDEIYRAHPWSWAMTTATIPLTSGVASLPAGALVDGPLDVREVNSGTKDDNVYRKVSYEHLDDYAQGDYRFTVTGSEGSLLIESPEADTTLKVRYQTVAPTINASISTPFPDKMTAALGALRYVRVSEDPEADISVEEANFQSKIDTHIAKDRRNNPRTRRTKHSVNSYYTGMV